MSWSASSATTPSSPTAQEESITASTPSERSLKRWQRVGPSTSIDIKKLVASGGTVMVERVDNFKLGGKPFDLEVAGVFDVDDNGRIKRWRDYYDLKSLEDRFTSAGIALPR